MDSMGDSPEALAAETARLARMRQEARRASLDAAQRNVAEAETPVHTRRAPPHRVAANLSNVAVEGASAFDGARPVQVPDGREAYRLGAVVLSEPPRAQPKSNTRIPLNEKPKDGPTNPRFRPPGR